MQVQEVFECFVEEWVRLLFSWTYGILVSLDISIDLEFTFSCGFSDLPELMFYIFWELNQINISWARRLLSFLLRVSISWRFVNKSDFTFFTFLGRIVPLLLSFLVEIGGFQFNFLVNYSYTF